MMDDAHKTLEIRRIEALDEPVSRLDEVAVEEPLELRLDAFVNGEVFSSSIAITMRTPGHDELLALGFLAGEGIISSMADINQVRHCGPVQPGQPRNVIRVGLRDHVIVDFQALSRNFYTTSSCGVCGKASLEALFAAGLQTVRTDVLVDVQTVFSLPEKLRQAQHVFASTGGLHAAAGFDRHGKLLAVFEDVGRHNALDKLCGWMLQESVPVDVLLLSGRASFELIQKAIAARIPVVAAVGAPSSLAVEAAREYGVTLIGFLRDGRGNLYSCPERLKKLSGVSG